MKVINTSARLLCFNVKKRRIDVLPGVVTDNKDLDKLKGNDKIFDHYLSEGILKEVKGKKAKADSGDKKTEKELLIEKAEGLGIDVTDLSIKKLKIAIHEAKNK